MPGHTPGGGDPIPPGGRPPLGFRPPAPSAFETSLDQFTTELGARNPGIFANADTVGGIAGQFGQFAQGEDPLLAQQRTQAIGGRNAQLARTGVTGSVAANEINTINQQFGQLQLGQRNQNLQTQAGLLGVQNQFTGEGLQNLLAEPTIRVAQEAAQNAGSGGGGGKKGGGK